MTCPVCGTVLVPGAHFCHRCGAAQAALPTPPPAERRVVTVLFGDLSDFTTWAEGVDPERVGAVTDRVLAALAGAVKTFGGHVDKLTGDGIMAVFGAPVAHEDDPERAVRAALAMRRAVRRILDDERGGGVPSGLRVGVNTGEVVAGVQAELEYTVVGDTVNTAARLADAAEVGSVYAGATTCAATGHVVTWRRLLPLRLKGKRHPVEAYELLAPIDGPLDSAGQRAGLGDEAPFVGRMSETEQLTSRLADVVDRGKPHVVVLSAEAGLGKTRLGTELARQAAGFDRGASAARVLTVRCAPYGESWRRGPLADLVRAAVGWPERPGVAVGRASAQERLRRVAQIVARRTGTEPRLATGTLLALLGHAEPGVDPEDRPGAHRTAAVTGHRMETDPAPAAVAGLLSALAREAPLVVIIDDLHNASALTLRELGVTLARLTGPVLILLLSRPELVHNAKALARLGDPEVIALSPLRQPDSVRLLSSYLDGGRLPDADADRLLTTAQGNPFYLAELVTLLIERGVLAPIDGSHPSDNGRATWRLDPESLSGPLLSTDLAAVLAARIDALSAESKALLRDAAVVGDIVPAAALAAIRADPDDPDPHPLPPDTPALHELLNRRMLFPVPAGYAFVTPLLREAAYAGVGKADLAERHARMVRWSAGLHAPVPGIGDTADALDGFVAEHTERANELADAVGLRPQAPARSMVSTGVAALSRLAHRAIRASEPGQAALHVERADRLAGGALPPPDRVVHASALLQLGRISETLAEAEKVAAEAEALGDADSWARGLLLAGRAHRMLGEAQLADQASAESLRVATEADLPAVRAEVLRRVAMADYLRGRLREAESQLHESLRIAEDSGDRRGQAWALHNLAWVETTLGEFAAADAAIARAARLFAALGDANGRAWLRGTTAFARLLAGRLDEARRLARGFLPFGERIGDYWAVGTLGVVEAYAAAELGELRVAQDAARHAYGVFESIDDDWGRGLALTVQAVIARDAGDAARAVSLAAAAVEFGQRTGHPLLLILAGTIRGFAWLDAGDPAAAAADAHAVLAVIGEHEVGDAARVGPRVLLGKARLAVGDLPAALAALRAAAAGGAEPSLLLSRRLAAAEYASALLAAGRPEQALAQAQEAVQLPAEDMRSQIVSYRVLSQILTATGDLDRARPMAAEARRLAWATQQIHERRLVEAALADLFTDQAAA